MVTRGRTVTVVRARAPRHCASYTVVLSGRALSVHAPPVAVVTVASAANVVLPQAWARTATRSLGCAVETAPESVVAPRYVTSRGLAPIVTPGAAPARTVIVPRHTFLFCVG